MSPKAAAQQCVFQTEPKGAERFPNEDTPCLSARSNAILLPLFPSWRVKDRIKSTNVQMRKNMLPEPMPLTLAHSNANCTG